MATLFLDLSPELEQQLLCLPPNDKLRLIQLLAQSLNDLWSSPSPEPSTQLSEFFRCSPLAEVAATGELDLSRDRSLPGDRFVLYQ
ncbi:hypothetical protein [Coleofasciculus sp. F4-SAH-05]|uniref:hypothetical protein n=1 Tax=Coleofasciculus sp. F4-SAH-05 TaxID=3069525 RepID=UPI0032F0D3EE